MVRFESLHFEKEALSGHFIKVKVITCAELISVPKSQLNLQTSKSILASMPNIYLFTDEYSGPSSEEIEEEQRNDTALTNFFEIVSSYADLNCLFHTLNNVFLEVLAISKIWEKIYVIKLF